MSEDMEHLATYKPKEEEKDGSNVTITGPIENLDVPDPSPLLTYVRDTFFNIKPKS